MELSVFLSQLFGIYAIIGGIAVMLRKSYFVPVFGAFAEERLTRLVVAILELFGGLALVLTHNVWGTLPEIIISIFGWALALEGTFYLIASDNVVDRTIRMFNNPSWYTFGGLFAIVLGLYLTAFGFGLI